MTEDNRLNNLGATAAVRSTMQKSAKGQNGERSEIRFQYVVYTRYWKQRENIKKGVRKVPQLFTENVALYHYHTLEIIRLHAAAYEADRRQVGGLVGLFLLFYVLV